MTLALLFWILMLLWLVIGALPYFGQAKATLAVTGPPLLTWVVIALLGWQVFGPAIHS